MSRLALYSALLGWFNILADMALKGTIILIPAILTGLLKKRLSSELRHLLLFVSICSLAVLPVFFQAASSMKFAGSVEVSSISPVPESRNQVNSTGTTGSTQEDGMLKAPEKSGAEGSAYFGRGFDISWIGYILVIWLAGFAFLLFRMLAGQIGVGRIRKKAAAAPPPGLMTLIFGISRELGLKRTVRLLISQTEIYPVTCGILHPAVILPYKAVYWSDERLRVVLLHELSHIKRRDNLTQLIAQFICALYWFNPLIWKAASLLRAERENACDDRVLVLGVKSVDYASQLLEIAKNFHPSSAPVFLTSSMTRISDVENRIMNILSTSKSRGGLSLRKKVICFTAILLLLIPSSLIGVYAFGSGSACSKPEVIINKNDNITVRDTKLGIEIKNVNPEELPFLWPFIYTGKVVESDFGSLKSYTEGSLSLNNGVDFNLGDSNVLLVATAGGIVQEISDGQGINKYIVIRHKCGLSTVYANIGEVFCKVGEAVTPGETIALSGKDKTFHYEIRYGQKALNPLGLMDRKLDIEAAEKRLGIQVPLI